MREKLKIMLFLFLFIILIVICYNIHPGSGIFSMPASVYLLPMQGDTHGYTVVSRKVNIRNESDNRIMSEFTQGQYVTANCTFSDEDGWCVIMEGTWRGNIIWQGCLNEPGGYPETEECW